MANEGLFLLFFNSGAMVHDRFEQGINSSHCRADHWVTGTLYPISKYLYQVLVIHWIVQWIVITDYATGTDSNVIVPLPVNCFISSYSI